MGRDKPGKPRRQRPVGPEREQVTDPAAHVHDGFDIADFTDPDGRPVDHKLLGDLVAAAYDGCTTCQDPLLTFMVEDPATSARTVELACVAIQGMFGGLPQSMTDEHAPGSTSSPEFRQLARAALDGENDAMFRECERMTPVQRRAAVNTAMDTLIGTMPY